MKTKFYMPWVKSGTLILVHKKLSSSDGNFPFVNYNNRYLMLRKLKNIQVGYNPLGIIEYNKLGTDFVMLTANIVYDIKGYEN